MSFLTCCLRFSGTRKPKPVYIIAFVVAILGVIALVIALFSMGWQILGTPAYFGLLGACVFNVCQNWTSSDGAFYTLGGLVFFLVLLAAILGLAASIFYFLKALNNIVINTFLETTIPGFVHSLLYYLAFMAMAAAIIGAIVYGAGVPRDGQLSYSFALDIVGAGLLLIAWAIVFVHKRCQKNKFCC
jgi:hypothetical protein